MNRDLDQECWDIEMTPKQADVESEYAKDPKLREEDVKILLGWLQKQPHLPKISEYKVIHFLQSCYYRIEAAKTTIENYYTVKAHCPEFFANRTVSSIDTTMSLALAYLLPKPSVDGYSVMFSKLVDVNTEHFVCNDAIKYFDMAVSLILHQIGTALGHVLVIDMEGTSFGHIGKVNITSARKYLYFLQEAMPVRIKEIHLLNVSPISQRLISLLKPFLKNDIVEMLHVHGSVEGLFDNVSKEALPEEYGGQGGNIQDLMEQQRKEFEANEDYFAIEEQEIANESCRIGKPKIIGDIFGTEGTFKKLDID